MEHEFGALVIAVDLIKRFHQLKEGVLLCRFTRRSTNSVLWSLVSSTSTYDVKRPTQIRRFVVALLVDTVEHEFGGIQKTKSPKGPDAPR
jgi:hypothetical protein